MIWTARCLSDISYFLLAAEPEQGVTLDESSSLLATGSRKQGANKTSEVIKAILYGLQVFYSFFIM